MRKLILTLFLVLGIGLVNAQTAIFVDNANGAVGFSTGYTNHIQQARQKAYSNGGINLNLLLATQQRGFVCITRAYFNGRYIFGVGYGYLIKADAQRRALTELRRLGYLGNNIGWVTFVGL